MAAYNSMYYSLYKLDNLIVNSSPTCVHDYILDRRLYFTRSYYTIYGASDRNLSVPNLIESLASIQTSS